MLICTNGRNRIDSTSAEGELDVRVNASFSLILGALFVLCLSMVGMAQNSKGEQPVPLNQAAIALDASGTPALEGRLRTSTLNGAPDMPVTNIRLVIKNVSPVPERSCW